MKALVDEGVTASQGISRPRQVACLLVKHRHCL